ncbi:hypothetical protein [Pontixanthobacter sp. CEM42]|uniref:hypothetical protein n=1 Tax=Pontixanthobacter sp. CEM42 TaxID=2792077 RepID=UPI001ADFF764|nr:hypothetical protein [Pontixanthobacter sp. CEM42]
MNTLAFVLSTTLIAATTTSDGIEDEGRVPYVGMEGPETDACPGIGRIARFAPKKGDFMRVYLDAHEGGKHKYELPLGSLVWLCEADEGWQGVVYPSGDKQELGDCRVSSSVSKPEPYSGPCQYGWVEAKYIELVAG